MADEDPEFQERVRQYHLQMAKFKESMANKLEKHLKELDANPKDDVAYVELGVVASKLREKIKLRDGSSWTHKELWLKAVDLNPHCLTGFQELQTLFPMSDSKKGDLTIIDPTPLTLLNGTQMTLKDLYMKVFELDPNDPCVYYNLGLIHPFSAGPASTTTLPDGRKMTKQQLYIKAIDLAPNYPPPYYRLALTLDNYDEEVQLLNGQKMTLLQLFLKNIDLDPQNLDAYYCLGCSVPSLTEPVQLLNGETWKKIQFFEEVVRLNPRHAEGYLQIGRCLGKGERTLQGGPPGGSPDGIDNWACYLYALRYEPDFLRPLLYIGKEIGPDRTFMNPDLLDGTVYTQRRLYLTVLERDKENGEAWSFLGDSMEDNETVPFPAQGSSLTRIGVYLYALAYDPGNRSAYSYLVQVGRIPNRPGNTVEVGFVFGTFMINFGPKPAGEGDPNFQSCGFEMTTVTCNGRAPLPQE